VFLFHYLQKLILILFDGGRGIIEALPKVQVHVPLAYKYINSSSHNNIVRTAKDEEVFSTSLTLFFGDMTS
jgi:hypothetical protein